MTEDGFYKVADGALLFAQNFVESPTYLLTRSNKNDSVLPDGWMVRHLRCCDRRA